MNQQLIVVIATLIVTTISVARFQGNYELLLLKWAQEELESYVNAGSPKSHQIYNTLPLLGFGTYKGIVKSLEIQRYFLKSRIHFSINLVLVVLLFWAVSNAGNS